MSTELDQIFAELNSCYYLGKQRLLFTLFNEKIEQAANNFFKVGQSPAEHDSFFGRLTPNKMGKRGDQIQRLFRSPAEVFLVQYWGQIEESVIEQLKLFAVAKSALEGRKIFYGIIDGQDTSRIIKSYPEFFV